MHNPSQTLRPILGALLLLVGCDDATIQPPSDSSTEDARKICGDGRCQGNETCSTCPADCGICSDGSAGQGGSSGSGGAGGAAGSGGTTGSDFRILSVGAIDITTSSANITWTLSAPGTGQVEYGPTTAYGSSSTLESSFTYATHVQYLGGLSSGTLYHYRARSTNMAGEVALSADHTFMTATSGGGGSGGAGSGGTGGGGTGGAGGSLPPPSCTTTAPAPNGSDQTAALQSWINAAPNGASQASPTVLCFPANASYVVNGTLILQNRNHLTFLGQNAEVRATILTSDPERGVWRTYACSGLTWRNLTVRGAHDAPGTYDQLWEWQHAFDIRGGAGLEIDHVTMVNNKGDCVYIRDWNATAAADVWVHDSSCLSNGRVGIAVIGGRNVLVERNTFFDQAMVAFDMEPNELVAGQGAFDITIQDNVVTGHAVEFFSAGGNGLVENIMVRRNRSETPWGLYCHGWVPSSNPGLRRSNFSFLDNSATSDVDHGTGASMYFISVDGLHVHGNGERVSSNNYGVKAVNSTNRDVSGNTFTGGLGELAP